MTAELRERLDAVRVQVPVSIILEMLGADIEWRSYGWAKVHCPFPGHANDDMHASGRISPDSTYYQCWACGVRGDVFSIVLAGGLAKDLEGAVQWVEDNVLNQAGSITGN